MNGAIHPGHHLKIQVERTDPHKLLNSHGSIRTTQPDTAAPQSLPQTSMPDEFDYSATISNLDIRENLPAVDPENLSSADVLQILLYLFQSKPGFIDRGHELNNRETAWINAILYRLKPTVDENGMDGFVVEKVGSSMDKMAELRKT